MRRGERGRVKGLTYSIGIFIVYDDVIYVKGLSGGEGYGNNKNDKRGNKRRKGGNMRLKKKNNKSSF